MGLLDYSERFYDPSIARWTSVDPLADIPENIAFSPYTYVWNNPINAIDPDGRSGEWIPEVKETIGSDGKAVSGNLILRKEEGDTAESLASFLSISQEKANTLYNSMENDVVELTDDISGVAAINNSIDAIIQKKIYAFGYNTSDGVHEYNCFTSCLNISKGNVDFSRDDNHTRTRKFDQEVNGNYSDVTNSPSKHKFGVTLMKMENHAPWSDFRTVHGAVYLGTSRNGTIYTWSKNGMVKAPAVKTLGSLKSSYYSWSFGGSISYHNY